MFGLFSKDSSKSININEVDQLDKNAALIDVREPSEYKCGSLKTAKNIPMGEIMNNPDKYLKKDGTYYIFCQAGSRSSKTCSHLAKQGYDVVNLTGGMSSYSGTKRK